MSNDELLTTLANKPRSTAKELGATTADMVRLEQAGRVQRVGTRKTGKRGKPPVEWAVAEQAEKIMKAVAEEVKQEPAPVANSAPKTEKVPKLPAIDDVRKYLDPEQARIVAYIEGQFKRGGREKADYDLLRSRYDDIVRAARRRVKENQ